LNVSIPIARPLPPPTEEVPARSGVEAEDLRRIRERAERYVARDAAASDAAMTVRDDERRAALTREQEILEARAIAARAQTLRAEATTHVAMAAAGGVVLAVLVVALLAPTTPNERGKSDSP
jgi:hypothetical protein